MICLVRCWDDPRITANENTGLDPMLGGLLSCGPAYLLLGLVAVAAVGGVAARAYRQRRQRWSSVLCEVADRLEIDPPQDRPVGSDLVAKRDDVPIRIGIREPGSFEVGEPRTVISLEGLPQRIRVFGRQRTATPIDPDQAMDGVDDLDARLVIRGPDEELLSTFDAAARRLVEEAFLEHGAQLDRGRLLVEWPGRVEDVDRLVEASRCLLRLAAALLRGVEQVPGRLLSNSFEDPDPTFRRRCMEALLRRPTRSAEASEAIRRGRVSDDPVLRYLALRQEPDGQDAGLRQLIRTRRLPDDLHAEAVGLLAPRYGGGLALEPAGGGELSVEPAAAGGLSPAAAAPGTPPSPRRPKKLVKG